MRPKMRVSPMPSRAYVPPSTRPFTRCWSSWSIRARRVLFLREEVWQRHLAVADLDHEDAGLALTALLAGGAVLLELDRAVDAHQAHLPERVTNRLGVIFAGDLDRLGDRGDAVVAAEPLGEPLERVAALGPLVDERLRELPVGHRLREPRHEEHDVIAALGRRAGLLDELGRRRAATGRDDLAAEPLLLRLLHHQRDLLDRRGEEERVAAGRLDLGELGVHVGGRLVHILRGADGGALLLQHVAERADGPPAPIRVDGQEVHALDAELVDVLLEPERFHLRWW